MREALSEAAQECHTWVGNQVVVGTTVTLLITRVSWEDDGINQNLLNLSSNNFN